jgi:hypothetical protein
MGTSSLSKQRAHSRAFTLAELLVSVSVLVLLVFLATQLINNAATVTVLGNKRMDADSEARQVLDRMAFDFVQMVKRSDADYYLKSSWFATGAPPTPTPPGPTAVRTVLQPGNDQMVFYSTLPGYYPVSGSPSPMSLVAYRVNSDSTSASYNKLERMAKGLAWNGGVPSPTPTGTPMVPVVFMPVPMSSAIPAPEMATPTPNPTPTPAWPETASSSAVWSGSEVIGPQVFRFEYYYLLKNGTLSDAPWDTTSSVGHHGVNGMQDVAAIVVVIAVVDPRSKVLVNDCQLAQLNGAPLPAGCSIPAQYPVLIDWGNTSCAGCPTQTQWQQTPGLLLANWRAAIDANSIGLPNPAISGVRVYERYFYLNQ